MLLEFPYEFISQEAYNNLPENDKKFKKILDPDHLNKIITPNELSGLLNKALDGLARLRKNKDFSYSIGTSEIKEMWIRKSNSFTAFCLDHIVGTIGKIISKAELRRKYNQYCKKFKLKGAGDKEIKATLEDLYAVDETRREEGGEYVNVWKDIAYIDKEDEDNVSPD